MRGIGCHAHFTYLSFPTMSMTSTSSGWNSASKSNHPRSAEFPANAAAAFGKKKPATQAVFSDTAVNAFSRPAASLGPRGFSEGAAAAFGGHAPTKGGFSESASAAFGSSEANFSTNAFGSDTRARGGFDDQAATAFGKKRPAKTSAPSTSSPLVSRRNDSFGALLAAAMPTLDTTGAASTDYSKSALRYTKTEASPKVMTDEMFPSLSPSSSTAASSPKTSFADVIRKRAQADAVEAQARKEAVEAERQRVDRELLNRPTVRPITFVSRNKFATAADEEEEEVNIHDLDYNATYSRKEKSRVYTTEANYDEEDDDSHDYNDAE